MKPKAGSLKTINKIKPSVRLTKRKYKLPKSEMKKGLSPSRVKKDYKAIL